jgi:hypothetical protein
MPSSSESSIEECFDAASKQIRPHVVSKCSFIFKELVMSDKIELKFLKKKLL